MWRMELVKWFGITTLLVASGLNLYAGSEETSAIPEGSDGTAVPALTAEPEKEAPVYFVGEYDPERDPAKDLEGALELARKEKKNVILQVGGDWCIWCRRMTEYFYENKPIREALRESYVIMKVNYSSDNTNGTFLAAYPKVPAFPHLFVLEADGKLLCSQYTGDLEEGGSYSETIMLEFLKKWTPEAVAEQKVTKLKPRQDIAVDLGGGVKMEFVWIKELKGWCGKYEVTNEEYKRFKSTHDSKDYKGHDLDGNRQPVVYVSWNDAQDFIQWMEKNCELPEGYTLTLPSKDEWLSVAQCGDGHTYPWGNEWPPEYGNYDDETVFTDDKIDDYSDGYAVTCPVKKSGENDWGVYGVGGNVCEWTEEEFGRSHYVLRGSSWHNGSYQPDLRCDFGGGGKASDQYGHIGFRLFLRP
ncbi:MAG: SUMF1/EgtB/PvdO family nonheme iron enzyme [Lentisphaerae bacterium]|nr:SUMF1/EgtB/PvdO family nonheme iron enzyme [Lentisphaerota bacterium]